MLCTQIKRPPCCYMPGTYKLLQWNIKWMPTSSPEFPRNFRGHRWGRRTLHGGMGPPASVAATYTSFSITYSSPLCNQQSPWQPCWGRCFLRRKTTVNQLFNGGNFILPMKCEKLVRSDFFLLWQSQYQLLNRYTYIYIKGLFQQFFSCDRSKCELPSRYM